VKQNFDTIIIGGGLVGAAVACGIAARGRKIAVLDGGDRDFRASRGNFGLIWVQGKGADFAPYARWSWRAAQAWPEFERDLRETTGIDMGLRQDGGYDFCLDQQEWDARATEMARVQKHSGGKFHYEMLESAELKQRMPLISDDLRGASYSPHDGHVNPLYLLRALQQRLQQLGADYLPGETVVSLRAQPDGFDVVSRGNHYHCKQLLLCAGLDNQRLAAELDMHIPVYPLRGQLLITERLAPFMPCASLQLRQTMDGTLQIGDSHEQVGLDDSTTLEVITRLAARAVRIFPHLAEINLVRAWGALRVMTPDGYPVYHRSEAHPGAFVLSCHSGVTLAALHAGAVADWVCDEGDDADIDEFSAQRFDVSTT
jgi:glycine/D-amino acid oxidase-like deaminating enzyme